MIDLFVVKLILSFLIGGLWVTFVTIIAEKYGTKKGGIVVGFPSTALFSLFFIAWTQSPSAAVEATTIMPAVGGIVCLFILCYSACYKRNFWLAIGLSLCVWAGLSIALIAFQLDNFLVSLLIYALLFGICLYLLERWITISSQPRRSMQYNFKLLLFRGVLSGLVVATAVVLSKLLGPVWGGLFAMFPAAMLGALLLIYFVHGEEFSSAVLKTSMLGAVSVVVYAICVRYTYAALGLWYGTLVSVIVSLFVSYVMHEIARRMR